MEGGVKVDFVAGALPYAERLGWSVFPLAPGTKVPYLPKARGGAGVHDASCDPEQIRAWGKVCATANIAVACGPILVVGVDPRHDGDKSLVALAARGHVLPPGPRQRTGNGGWHYVFKGNPRVGNSTNKLGPGVDVKSTGGYILAAPSWTRPSQSGPGGQYVWEASPFDIAVPRMPLWMVAILCPPEPAKSWLMPDTNGGDIETLARFVAGSSKGERNNRLHWAACRAAEMAARHKVSAESAGRRLVAAAAAAGYVGPEVANTIDSAFRKTGQRFN